MVLVFVVTIFSECGSGVFSTSGVVAGHPAAHRLRAQSKSHDVTSVAVATERLQEHPNNGVRIWD